MILKLKVAANCSIFLRAKNVGWRLDYFLVSTRLMDKVKESKIREKVFGSDHCPIVMTLDAPK